MLTPPTIPTHNPPAVEGSYPWYQDCLRAERMLFNEPCWFPKVMTVTNRITMHGLLGRTRAETKGNLFPNLVVMHTSLCSFYYCFPLIKNQTRYWADLMGCKRWYVCPKQTQNFAMKNYCIYSFNQKKKTFLSIYELNVVPESPRSLWSVD